MEIVHRSEIECNDYAQQENAVSIVPNRNRRQKPMFSTTGRPLNKTRAIDPNNKRIEEYRSNGRKL